MGENKSSYGNIFKTTFLFGFVQVFKAVVSIVVNKLAAILIGSSGMGLLGIYNNVISLIQTGAGLGLNQSAVRDVAEANETGNIDRRNRVINITLKAVLYTGLLGLLVTVCLSYFISDWSLGDHGYTLIYCVLAIVVCLNIINDGRQAVLKGMRLMRYLAYASIIGSGASLFISVPLYYYLGTDGIVPALLLSSMLALIVSNHYINKIGVPKANVSINEIRKEATPMVKIGVVLMLTTFLTTVVVFCINAFVRHKGGIVEVGFYSTGRYLLNGYFGLVITALLTDYYPRIAAVNSDNKKLSEELNRQTIVTMVILCPMIVIFITLLPMFIKLLYTEDFLSVVDYVRVAIFGTIIMAFSNPIDMLFVVKQDTKVLMFLSILLRIFQLIVSYILYTYWGLVGLGVAFMLVFSLHCFLVSIISKRKYGITYSSDNFKVISSVLSLAIISALLCLIQNAQIRSVAIVVMIVTSFVISYVSLREFARIDVFQIVKVKLFKH